MYRLRLQELSRCVAFRYIVLFIFVCFASNVYAQRNISHLIDEVLESHDVEKCKMLMQQIKESDIANMSDSTLFNYYYLAGWYYCENQDFDKQIDCLVKAKEVCETKLGINNNAYVYFEIIKALGEASEDLDKSDEALLWYEEGIIKGLPYLDSNDETLKEYFKDIRNYSADIYEAKGHMDIANYLRADKPLDYLGSFDHACDLHSEAIHLLYDNNNYIEAIRHLDEAKIIFKKNGNDGKKMLQLLYQMYLPCYAKMGDKKKIDGLLRTKSKTMFQNDNESSFVKSISEIILIFLVDHHDVKTAEYYLQKILNEIDEKDNEDFIQVEKLRNQIGVFKKIYSQIDSLENVKRSVPISSYEWGISSLQQSNLLIRIQRYNDANKICEQIYSMSSALKEDPQNLHWFVLMNLADYYSMNKDLSKTEQYLQEQLSWLDSKKVPSYAEERGWVYNKLGIAYLNAKDFAKSKEMLNKAEKNLVSIYGYQSKEYATILHNKGRLAYIEGQLKEAKQYLEKSERIQIDLEGKAMERTTQYLDEVNKAINVRL